MTNQLGTVPSGKFMPVVLSLLSVFSFAFNGTVSKDEKLLEQIIAECQGVGFVFFACAVMLIWISVRYWEFYRKNTCTNTKVVAGLLSACMLVGMSYSVNNSWEFIFAGRQQFLIAMIVYGGYLYFFDFLIVFAYKIIHEDRFGVFSVPIIRKNTPFSKRSLLIAFVVIYAGWLVWLVPFMPGSVPHDGAYQLGQFFNWLDGGGEINNHHPWVSTIIFGVLAKTGRLVNDDFAIGFTVFFLSFIECLIYSYVCKIIFQKFNSLKLYITFVLFYALVPIFGEYAQAVLKDGPYAAIMSLYVIVYLRFFEKSVHKTGNLIISDMIKLIGTGVFVTFMRNEGVYIVLVSLGVLFIVADYKKKIAVLTVIAIFSLNICAWNSVTKEKMKIATPFTKEMLSIPLQQSARYVRDYTDDISESEVNALSSFLDYRNLAKLYDPQISDAVKGYNVPIDKDTFIAYLGAWKSMFLKHPDAYFQATLNNTFGYYYPFCQMSHRSNVFYIGHDAMPDFKNDYMFSYYIHRVMLDWSRLWSNIPVLSQATNSGIYSWFLLFFIGYMAKFKRNKLLLALNIPVLLFCVCLASPVNGDIRYALSLVSTFPIYFCWVLKNNSKCHANTVIKEVAT